ncbi:MAG: thioredoxin family protein [Nanoarchaeota archaeon]
MKKTWLLVVCILLITGSIIYLEGMKVRPGKIQTAITDKNNQFPIAPELSGIAGYINSANNLTLASLRGKVVLIDFWTYTCINCIRTQPYLNAWYDKYHEAGLEIIGVHTPEFGFEKKYENVLSAVEREGIKYPVVQDNEYETWRAYQNQYWPRKYLIDSQGKIRYDKIGEGGYQETEEWIRKLLKERNETLQLKQIANVSGVIQAGRVGTPEIYFGYGFNRGNFGNKEGLKPEESVNYTIANELVFNNAYLEGVWLNKKDYVELDSDSGRVALPFYAKAVNIVASAEDISSISVFIDGKQIVTGTDFSNGLLNIKEERLYSLFTGSKSASQTLDLRISGKGFRIYTFTFG